MEPHGRWRDVALIWGSLGKRGRELGAWAKDPHQENDAWVSNSPRPAAHLTPEQF